MTRGWTIRFLIHNQIPLVSEFRFSQISQRIQDWTFAWIEQEILGNLKSSWAWCTAWLISVSFSTQVLALIKRSFRQQYLSLIELMSVVHIVTVTAMCLLLRFRLKQTEKPIKDRLGYISRFHDSHFYSKSRTERTIPVAPSFLWPLLVMMLGTFCCVGDPIWMSCTQKRPWEWCLSTPCILHSENNRWTICLHSLSADIHNYLLMGCWFESDVGSFRTAYHYNSPLSLCCTEGRPPHVSHFRESESSTVDFFAVDSVFYTTVR